MTLSPVSSTWMPPGQVPSARWARTKPAISAHDVVEVRGSCGPLHDGERVAVHRVARPHHRVAGVARPARSSGRSASSTLSAPMRVISVSRPGMRAGLSALAQLEHEVGGGRRRADLAAERVADAAEELDVGAVELAGALADPQHVRRAVVPAAGQRVLAGERLLVAEDAAPRGWCRSRPRAGSWLALGVDAAGAHEPQRPVDLGGELLVAADPRGSTRRTPGSTRAPGRGRRSRPW